MSKAFTKETDTTDDDLPEDPASSGEVKNYITPAGHKKLKDELLRLLNTERPDLVKTIAWAAANGDRSENADYIYGKRRLREIDRRIRFLTKRLDIAEIVDTSQQESDRVFFGATVTVCDQKGVEHTYRIVGTDEIDTNRGWISWKSPMASALLKAREGDIVTLRSPGGETELEIVEVNYKNYD